MTRSLQYFALMLAIVAGAAVLRLWQLDHRPMHVDEAVHAVKLHTLWETGRYVYDPEEYHGPTLYYLTLPILWICGVHSFAEFTESMLRIVPAIFGIAMVLLLLLVRDGLGRAGTLCAAILTAVSPAMVYYGRYYIQETLLVFFTFLAIAAGWRFVRSRRAGWAILAGGSIGLMHATKETSVIAFGCILLALAANILWHWRPRGVPIVLRGYLNRRSVAVAVVAGIAASVILYSAFLTNAAGPIDALRTYGTYFDRAGGHGLHDHPWNYYFSLLLYFQHQTPRGPVWSEALIVALAIVGVLSTLGGRTIAPAHLERTAARQFIRFVAIYTVLMLVVYSAIPYKTPWCMLGFLHGMILLAGVGTVTLVRSVRFRPAQISVSLVLVAGCAHLLVQTRRAITTYDADYRNPYVYSHTVRGTVRLADWIERLAAVHPDGHDMLIRVVTPDYWPLPWYLRNFSHVGYWDSPPPDCDAPVVITSPELLPELERRFRREYTLSNYGLRPNVRLIACVDRDLYEAYAETAARREGEAPAEPWLAGRLSLPRAAGHP